MMVSNDDDLKEKTIEEIHRELNMQAMNVRLYEAAEKIWNKMSDKENELYEKSNNENLDNLRDHFWWQRVALLLSEQIPEPIYT